MKIYELKYTEKFEQDKELLRKAGNISLLKKLANILRELVEHPTTGTGKPKQLSGDRVRQWSRRISSKHRLVYMIDNENVVVLLLSAYRHYDYK